MWYFCVKKIKKKEEKSKKNTCVLSCVSFVVVAISYSRKLEIYSENEALSRFNIPENKQLKSTFHEGDLQYFP